MKAAALQHGDVLLFEHRSHQSIFVRGIRLICGSRFVHCGTVQGYTWHGASYLVVLEQLAERTFESLSLYRPDVGEVIHCVRPTFAPHSISVALFSRLGYGYWGIVDCLINHLLGRLTLRRWRRRRMLGLLKPENLVCSQLVGVALGTTDWETAEPDDYFNDTGRFTYLGVVDWS